jgi:periplasmic nitrate reductase NapD
MTMAAEIHIAGIIVHVTPAQVAEVRAQLAILPRCIVHAAEADGRLIVTLEAESAPRTLDAMDAIRALSGVLNVALVYQHAEPANSMDEELQ